MRSDDAVGRPRFSRGRVRALVGLVAFALAGCGSDGGATQPGEKTCQQDPTQAKCAVNNPPASAIQPEAINIQMPRLKPRIGLLPT